MKEFVIAVAKTITADALDKILKGEMDDILPEISAVKGNAVDELIEGGTGIAE